MNIAVREVKVRAALTQALYLGSATGFAGWPFLVRYRLLSVNEENGNYILTAFIGLSAPTGSQVNRNGHAIFTPTIAGIPPAPTRPGSGQSLGSREAGSRA